MPRNRTSLTALDPIFNWSRRRPFISLAALCVTLGGVGIWGFHDRSNAREQLEQVVVTNQQRIQLYEYFELEIPLPSTINNQNRAQFYEQNGLTIPLPKLNTGQINQYLESHPFYTEE